jgi:hypothetical protein
VEGGGALDGGVVPDPVVVWATPLGGAFDDCGEAVVADGSRCRIVTVHTTG